MDVDRHQLAPPAQRPCDTAVHLIEDVDGSVRLDVERRRAGEAELTRSRETEVLWCGAPAGVDRTRVCSARATEDMRPERNRHRAAELQAPLRCRRAGGGLRDRRGRRVVSEHGVVGETVPGRGDLAGDVDVVPPVLRVRSPLQGKLPERAALAGADVDGP